MVSSNQIKFLLLYLISFPALALVETKLPLLLTKQSIFNLRWVSLDGERTYYQRSSGDLILSTKYRVIEILKGKEDTNYTVHSTRHRKAIVFSKDENFHTWLGIRHPKQIYVSSFNSEKKPDLLGWGIKPQLHLADQWVSYFDPLTRVIHLVNTKHKVLRQQIQLRNTHNPYFVPEVTMADKDTIIYTDINSKGQTGVLIYKKLLKKVQATMKVSDVREKIEFCNNGLELIIGVFGTSVSKQGSQIYTLPIQKLDFKQLSSIYKSKLNDIGNIECDQSERKFYFSKNITVAGEKQRFEIAEIDIKTKKVKLVSDLEYATELINLDGRLLIQHRGHYYVLKGEENLRKDDIFKL
ncbi:MAG: hypothetical protein ACO20H_06610 [Bacteriovoracaceae bacterium]